MISKHLGLSCSQNGGPGWWFSSSPEAFAFVSDSLILTSERNRHWNLET